MHPSDGVNQQRLPTPTVDHLVKREGKQRPRGRAQHLAAIPVRRGAQRQQRAKEG